MKNAFTFNGAHSDTYLIVNKTQRDMLPPLNDRTLSVPNRPGAYYFGTDLGIRQIDVDVTIIDTTQTDFRTKIRNIAKWLFTDTAKPLIFDDEPAFTYYAKLSQNTKLEQIITLGEGTITFLCFDPYAYGSETTPQNLNTNNKVTRYGTASALPVITAIFTAAASEFKIQQVETGKYIRVTHAFVADDVLLIDNEKGLITLNGSRIMPDLDITSEFFDLVDGDNTMLINPAGVATSTLVYKPRWL